MDAARWEEKLLKYRRGRDAYYSGPKSPIPPEARARWPGLAFFPPDPGWRLPGRLVLPAAPRRVAFDETGGDTREYEVAGTFRFVAGTGEAFELVAFAPTDDPDGNDYLFIPFRDATSGSETYGGGRYMHFDLRASGEYVVDFNYAYQPFCAYNEAWSCVVPPVENTLKVAVRAGERLGKG